MTGLYSDTHPKMEALQIELIRRMPAWKKFAVVDGLNAAVKTLAMSGIRQRHPNATPAQIQHMLSEVSERQWRDVLGVLKTRAGELDIDYLRKWADELKVPDLLERALNESR